MSGDLEPEFGPGTKLGRKRWLRAVVIIGLAALMVAAGALASWWNSNRTERQPKVTDRDSQVIEYSELPGSGEPNGAKSRVCLDGSKVSGGKRCADLRSNEVMFAATGVAKAACESDREYGWNAPGQSFSCTAGGADVRVARYRSASHKAERLAKYGSCSKLPGGWQLCGPNPENNRYVRTFTADDLLFYVSSSDKDALLGLKVASDIAARVGR